MMRAMLAENSFHGMFRFRANAARLSLALDTIPKVRQLFFPSLNLTEHRQDGFFELDNGSRLYVGGLDDKDRIEKILGLEFATIFLNECSQIAYQTYLVASTRLAQVCYYTDENPKSETFGMRRQLQQRLWCDLNPTGKSHWTNQLFREHKDPVSRQPINNPENYGFAFVNPLDNAHNLTPEFIESLQNLPEKQKKRFLEGEYVDEIDGALWSPEIIERNRCTHHDIPEEKRSAVVIAVDPSGAANKEDDRADEIGIIAMCRGQDGHAYVLEDATCRETPHNWARIAVNLFRKYRADCIVAESNFGGAMVEAVIKSVDVDAPVRLVVASRGKHIRAEPISALYANNKIHHVGRFPRLEDQLCAFSPSGYMDKPTKGDITGQYISNLNSPYITTTSWNQNNPFYANGAKDTNFGWFGPLEPLYPIAPPEVAGRQFDYQAGYNLNTVTRPYSAVPFWQLRALADGYDILRIIIETRKNEIGRKLWAIKPREEDGNKEDPDIKQIEQFFRRPDGIHDFRSWLKMLVEDLFVIDALAVYVHRNKAGKMINLFPIAGDTIKPVIDDWGRRPGPIMDAGKIVYPVAYQQILHGYPAIDYSMRDLIYRPMNVRTNHVYGYSIVEQIIGTIQVGLRRQSFLLDYYEDGTIPDCLIGTPDTWCYSDDTEVLTKRGWLRFGEVDHVNDEFATRNKDGKFEWQHATVPNGILYVRRNGKPCWSGNTPDQISAYQRHWDSYFDSNLARKRKAKFVPGGVAKTFIQTKEPELKGELDEWIARVCCKAFAISPTGFVRDTNRATAEVASSDSEAQGLQPVLDYIVDFMDYIIEVEFGRPDLTFAWQEDNEVSATEQQTILSGYVTTGQLTINESRAIRGLPPLPDPEANQALIMTANGYVPLNQQAAVQQKVNEQKALQPLQPKPAAPGPQNVKKAFDPDEPRDEHGRWTDDGGGQGTHTELTPKQQREREVEQRRKEREERRAAKEQAAEEYRPIELDDDFPTGDSTTPAHPRCRCTVVPVVDQQIWTSGGDSSSSSSSESDKNKEADHSSESDKNKEATSEGTTSLRTAIRYGGLAACATGASIFAGTLLPEVAGFAIGGTVVGVAARATAQLALHYAGQAAIAYAIQKGVEDRTNEICDYATTKPLYEKWSGDFHKATDGKSMGNLRSMHGNVAAGKVTSVAFNDEAKQIEICAKVVDDNEWKKVLEGVYTGFSQGGAYEKRWKDEGSEYTRYTANPSEISLVDLPCLPSATFKVIKADGMQVEKSFVSVEEQNVNEPEEEFETKIISKRDGSAHNSIEQLKAHHIKLEAEELAKQEASAALELVGSLSKTFGETTETAEATEVEKLEASVEELAKVGARNSKTDKERIQAVHDHACALGADCPNKVDDTDMDGKAAEIIDLRKRADELEIVKEQLAKANALVAAKEAIITDQMLPLLQKMQKSIEALEAQPTPLPWQVGTKVISKNGDTGVAAGSTDNVPSLEELMSKMTQEEKQVFLMKMAHQFPQR
ncbi:unnamed protein product [Sphagnum tenellum]